MKSLIRKTEINWAHFTYGLPFLFIGSIMIFIWGLQPLVVPFFAIGTSYSIGEILYGENPQ